MIKILFDIDNFSKIKSKTVIQTDVSLLEINNKK